MPSHVVNFMHFIAQEMREHMAKLGFRTVNEMIGRADKMEMTACHQALESCKDWISQRSSTSHVWSRSWPLLPDPPESWPGECA